MPEINKPNNDNEIWYEGKPYRMVSSMSGSRYFFSIGYLTYVAIKENTARNDQGNLVAIEAYPAKLE